MASISPSDHGPKTEAGCSGGGGERSETVAAAASDEMLLYRSFKKAKKERGCTAKERISKMPPCTAGKRSSIYRGVTRHRWTGRYEAHLWDKTTWNQNQNKKGKQVYLGAYDDEEAAARAYDLAALKYWGPGTLINFPVADYARDLEEMQNLSREEYLASLRRKSSGFSRGIAKYRGLQSRWDASASCMPESEYFSNIHYGAGDDLTGLERKIDLTGYIKWWEGVNKTRQHGSSSSKPSHDTKVEDVVTELKTLEHTSQTTTEPYKSPNLSVLRDTRRNKSSSPSSSSSLSILSQSPAYKSLASKTQESNRTDENANCNIIDAEKIHGKAIEKSMLYPPLTSLLTSPLLTNYNTLDHLADPLLWLPSGPSHTSEVTKTETYSYLPQEK